MKTFIGFLLLSVSWLPLQEISHEFQQLNVTNFYEKPWQMSKVLNMETDEDAKAYWNSLPSCAKDDILIFTTDEVCYNRNEKCVSEEGVKECYRLQKRGENTFIISDATTFISVEILSASKTTMVMRYFWYGNDGEDITSYFDIEYNCYHNDLAIK